MKFRNKPVVIEAVQWDGKMTTIEPLLAKSIIAEVGQDFLEPDLIIPTLEGDMRAKVGDWIILGAKGELYPCKPDIFEATYAPEDGSGICGAGEDGRTGHGDPYGHLR